MDHPDNVESHDNEPPGLGDSDEPYLLPEINPKNEIRELPFCREDD